VKKQQRDRELARRQAQGQEKLAQLVQVILNRTGGKPAATDNDELTQLCRQFQLSSELAKPIIAAAQTQWKTERQREEQAETLRLQEQTRKQRELAEIRSANLRRLKADGRLNAWVDSRLAGWERLAWISLLAELKQSGFWPLPLAELRLLLSSIHGVKTAAYLADAEARMRVDEPGGMPAPTLALPIRGVWYSRENDQHAQDWQFEALLPSVVSTMNGREYLLGITPEVEDADLAPLGGLQTVTELRALHLAWCERITDAGLKHVQRLIQLQSLEVSIADRVTDAGLARLGELQLLQSLVLHRCYGLQDSALRLLQPLRSLESLTLWGCRQITDASVVNLAAFNRLRSLGLWSCRQMTDAGLTGLVTLPRLDSLTICHCPEITIAGITKLRALPSLRQLNVYRCCQIATPDVTELQAEMPHCKITIVSANADETTALRRHRLSLSYQGRITSLRKKPSRPPAAPSETSPQEPAIRTSRPSTVTSPQKSIDPCPLAEPTLPPRKNWWEIWK
jgi:hypothetical protein